MVVPDVPGIEIAQNGGLKKSRVRNINDISATRLS
jgi:hypothetical protein